MVIRRAVVVGAGLGALLLAPIAGAVASTGPGVSSQAWAGYAFAGGRFKVIDTWVRMPDAARFARYVGQVAVSLQLRTAGQVLDLTATACTDTACRPGGAPRQLRYRLQFAVYNSRNGALVCSTSAAGSKRCPGVPRSWTAARITPGSVVSFALAYPPSYGILLADIGNQEYAYPISNQVPPRQLVFSQARIGIEVGATPWARAAFRAPAAPVAVASFDRPPPPPYAAEIVMWNGNSGGFDGWWTRHPVTMTGGPPRSRAEAAPGRLWDNGYGFTVYLRP